MSNTQYAFLPRSKVPNRDALQASIDALGFDLKLDAAFTPFTDSGFSPCVLLGQPGSGFQIFYEPTGEEFASIAGGNDFCISMSWGGSMKDCACAMVVGCALIRDFGAIVSYEGNPPDTAEQLLAETRDAIRQSQLPEAPSKPRLASRKPWWKIW